MKKQSFKEQKMEIKVGLQKYYKKNYKTVIRLIIRNKIKFFQEEDLEPRKVAKKVEESN